MVLIRHSGCTQNKACVGCSSVCLQCTLLRQMHFPHNRGCINLEDLRFERPGCVTWSTDRHQDTVACYPGFFVGTEHSGRDGEKPRRYRSSTHMIRNLDIGRITRDTNNQVSHGQCKHHIPSKIKTKLRLETQDTSAHVNTLIVRVLSLLMIFQDFSDGEEMSPCSDDSFGKR